MRRRTRCILNLYTACTLPPRRPVAVFAPIYNVHRPHRSTVTSEKLAIHRHPCQLLVDIHQCPTEYKQEIRQKNHSCNLLGPSNVIDICHGGCWTSYVSPKLSLHCGSELLECTRHLGLIPFFSLIHCQSQGTSYPHSLETLISRSPQPTTSFCPMINPNLRRVLLHRRCLPINRQPPNYHCCTNSYFPSLRSPAVHGECLRH
ncbi:hypothetical protein PAXRUDRAFT_279003 [Paxillus rubicundulus Ve08.2h10]|uniref:Uncharacterized protein n=1 Tax=Paxillus rubicundulus Ve08.2h10 TaxID=930991 RepID=A0A0D0C9C3_9AGAM|nr:hypothetical protein PAXRUDRAFT_279003 [Paxillus rubicundulus Ve08.2h10]